MYNWVTTRKIPRTEGPNTPTRAAQTVDITVAKWIPATAALLACFVTPARAKLDARYYAQPTYPLGSYQLVNGTMALVAPIHIFEKQSFRTDARPPMDVCRYEWAPEFVSIPRLVDQTILRLQPAFAAELSSFRTESRAPLDVRRYEWASDESPWIQQEAADDVQSWAPAFSSELASFETAACEPLDVRSYDWAPQQTPWIDEAADNDIQTWMPAVDAELASFRTAAAPTDVRTTQPGYTNSLTSVPTVDQTVPAWTNQESSDRTAASGFNAYSTTPLFTSFATLPPAGSPTTAQTAPAWANSSCNFRTPNDPTPFDVFRNTSEPNTAGVPDDWVLWVPAFSLEASSFRTPAASTDVRVTAPGFISVPTIPVATVAQTAPAWTNHSRQFRTPAASVDVRSTAPGFTSSVTIPVSVSVAQTVPAWLSTQSFRTAAAPALDLFRMQSIPDIFGVPDDWITWVPLQDDGGRTADRARLDVRRYDWIQPAWITVNIPAVQVPVPQQVPALQEAAGALYRTPARQQLPITTEPSFTWAPQVVDTTVRTWISVFDAELASTRTPARVQVPVTTEPQPAWIFTSIPVDNTTPAQRLPALIEAAGLSFRTADRAKLDVRTYEWTPEFTWVQPVLDRTVSTWIGIFDAELASFKTIAQLQAPITTEPQPAWILSTIAPDATVPQRLPALLQNAGVYRLAERAKLDVRSYEWLPQQGWTATAVDKAVASWVGVLDAELQSFRTGSRAPLDVRTYEWSPSFSWVLAPATASVAKWIGTFSAELQTFRTTERAKLDLRAYDWNFVSGEAQAATAVPKLVRWRNEVVVSAGMRSETLVSAGMITEAVE